MRPERKSPRHHGNKPAGGQGGQKQDGPKQDGQPQGGPKQGGRQQNGPRQGGQQQGGQKQGGQQRGNGNQGNRQQAPQVPKAPPEVILAPVVKVCGMKDPENSKAVAATEPDFMGFIFYPESPRFVGDDFEMPNDLPEFIKTVGVFVNAGLEEIIGQFDRHYLAYVQLHGDEPASLCADLSKEGVAIIKAFSVGPDFDFRTTKPYEAVCDFFLFDTKGEQPGGNGTAFDWTLLRRYSGRVPFFLSGGISGANIAKAMDLKLKGLYGFDINSGAEVSPGIKDPALIVDIKQKIKEAFERKP